MGWQDAPLAEAQQPAWMSAPLAEAEPTMLDRLKRTAGLGVRAAGPVGAGALVGAGIGSIVPGIGTAAGGMAGAAAMGGAQLIDRVTGMNATDALMDKMGIPRPETPGERISGDVVGAMAGVPGMTAVGNALAGSARPVASAIGRQFAAGPGMQVVSGATGAGAASVARESGVGPTGQFAAGVAGAMAPGAVIGGGSAAVRGVARGGEAGRQRMVDRTQTFSDAGADTISVGQASGSRAAQAFESGLSKTPGGAGPMLRAGEAQSSEMGAKVNAIADQLMPNATGTRAGAKIEQGVKDFVQRFKGEQTFLYDKLDQHIPAQTRVDVSNTKAALADLNADIPGAPALSQWFKNSKIQGIQQALESDVGQQGAYSPSQLRTAAEAGPQRAQDLSAALQEGKLPYEAVKKLRTLVGNEITNNTIASDVPRSKWKALYAALSDDLGVAAKQAGPDAERSFARANTYSRAGYDRIETYLDRVAGKDTVEKIFQAAVNPSEIKEGGSTVNAVMRSLDKDQRKAVQAAFIKRMGTATAGNLPDTGEKFSAATFLTNWNKVSPEARLTLFADGGGDLTKNLNKIASASNMIKEGSKVFANPSGTQQAISNQATTGGAVASILLGHPGVAATLAGGAVAANLSARLMTNPKFVGWLAKSTEMSPAMIPAQLNTLTQIAKGQPPGVRAEMEQYATQIGSQLASTPKERVAQ